MVIVGRRSQSNLLHLLRGHIFMSNKSVIASFVLMTTLFLVACGGSSGRDLMGKYSVNDVNILADNIEVGETVRLEVFFETKIEDDGFPDGLELIVRIPPELAYVVGTSRIYDGSTDVSDAFTPNFSETCPTGETYLSYFFQDIDLFDRELDQFGQFGIRLELVGRTPVSSTLVGATAGEREGYRCGEEFAAEENEAVEVLSR